MRATLSDYHPGSARVATLLGNALTRLAEAEVEHAGARGGFVHVPAAASSRGGTLSSGTRTKRLKDASDAYGFAAEALGTSYGEDHAETIDARARETTARRYLDPATEGTSEGAY